MIRYLFALSGQFGAGLWRRKKCGGANELSDFGESVVIDQAASRVKRLSEHRAGKPLYDVILTNDNPMEIMLKEAGGPSAL